jgi:hypothetical protein
MVTDLQESNPNSSENLQEADSRQIDSNGHSTENDNATFISSFENFFLPIRLVR